MKQILYRRKQSLKNRRKMISINEHAEDKDCKTHVRKSFAYIVTQAKGQEGNVQDPEIHINKFLDTKKHIEKFSFRVKGSFLMTRDRTSFKVDFCHTLRIDIEWKKEAFSPKKSVTLT